MIIALLLADDQTDSRRGQGRRFNIHALILTVYRELALSFLRPSSLPQGHFIPCLGSTAVIFASPGEVLPETELGVGGVIEIDLRDLGLDESPDAPEIHYMSARCSFHSVDIPERGRWDIPVETGDATEPINILKKLIHRILRKRRIQDSAVLVVALYILGQEVSPNSPCRHHVVVAVETAPFGKVVGDVERRGRWGCVLVVDEVHSFGFIIF